VRESGQLVCGYQPLLSGAEREAWTGFLFVHAALTRALDDDLRANHGLAYNAFELLALLALAPGRRLRMAELAELLVFTRSGITRLIERLERQGYVERRECSDDARGVNAILTEQGFLLFEQAARTHVARLRELFFGRLEQLSLAELNQLWQRLNPEGCSARERLLELASGQA